MARKEFTYNDKDVPVGIRLPLSKLSNELTDNQKEGKFLTNSTRKNSGIFSVTYSTKEQVYYNLKNLISTQKGERKLNLQFGIDWNKYFFNQKDKTVIENLKEEIKEQCKFWLPFLDVNVQVIEDIHTLKMYISYKFKNESEYNEHQSIILNINNED